MEVQRIIAESYAEACRLLRMHRAALDALVGALLARETLGEAEILSVTGLPPAAALATRRADALVADATAEVGGAAASKPGVRQ